MTKKINPNLTAEQKLILFEEGTERAGSSELNHEKREGSFHCANCGEKLFDSKTNYPAKKSISDLDVELDDNMKDEQYLKLLKFYLNHLNEENFDFVFYIAGVDIHFNDRLGKLKISDEGIKSRDELVIENFFSKRIPFCGVLGGGYNKDFNKLVELHSILHKSCAKFIKS